MYTVAAARWRRTLRWLGAVLGVAIMAGGVVIPTVAGLGSAVTDVTLPIGIFGGGLFAGWCAWIAVREPGFTGHGSGWAVLGKHAVSLVKEEPVEPPPEKPAPAESRLDRDAVGRRWDAWEQRDRP